jgi:hypothetical protein
MRRVSNIAITLPTRGIKLGSGTGSPVTAKNGCSDVGLNVLNVLAGGFDAFTVAGEAKPGVPNVTP